MVKNFPFRWNEKQKEILKEMHLHGKSFQEIADEINTYLKRETEGYDLIPHRSDRSVAYQCLKLNLISKEELEEWDKKRDKLRIKDRSKGLIQIKKKVLERDGNKCIICNSNKNLDFAHIIPFRQTRSNIEAEAITLCGKHHKDFDDGDLETIESVFRKMSKYYSDYEQLYSLTKTLCSVHGEHINIRKL